ncbi:MAG TPA: hypothetical protein VLQ45_16675 [Thermoanaerobaculia bacterium]|nr:hypothetical protein [Thermoanaerobaculia bacterium]
MKKLVAQTLASGLLLLAVLALPAAVTAQALPTPARFVENLDVRCYRIPNQPPLNVNLRLDHLNPVFISKGLPPEFVTLFEPQELCVPVQKDQQVPPPDVLPFIRYVDLKCYRITGPPINVDLSLSQLNPVIAHKFGPDVKVTVREPQQLCVPVAKNNMVPPTAILNLISQLDVKCYRVESSQVVSDTIGLTHLNPLFSNTTPETVKIPGPAPRQLCVPVAKNQQIPPPAVLPIIRFSDVLCYDILGLPLNMQLTLNHLNPVLRNMGLPAENVFVTDSTKLCVPVAKDGQVPPG